MTDYFHKKNIWITGASSGIGAALATACAAQGANIVLSARSADKLAQIAGQCTTKTHILPLDLEQTHTLAAHAHAAIAAFGGIDMVFHCGGFSQRSLAHETTFDVYQRLINVHYLGVVAINAVLLPHFIQRKSGHFIAISSLVGKFGSPLRTGYAAAKHAMQGYFDSLRPEISTQNLRVTVVCPGYIHTDVSINALNADGTNYKKMDTNQAQGISAAHCADKILQGVAANKKEIYIGGKEILGIYIKRFFPFLMDNILQKQVLNKRQNP
jgi:short-subunit dehydrogenase